MGEETASKDKRLLALHAIVGGSALETADDTAGQCAGRAHDKRRMREEMGIVKEEGSAFMATDSKFMSGLTRAPMGSLRLQPI